MSFQSELIKEMTQELANQIVNESFRCTQATLRAFGIIGIPRTGSGCLEYLKQAGFRCTEIKRLQGRSLKQFQRDKVSPNPLFRLTGSYLINTPGHAIAVINGTLVDTERKGWDSRKIQFAWRVEK